MKLLDLAKLCERAANKHGNTEIYFHQYDDAYEVSAIEDCQNNKAKLRLFSGSHLPGVSIDDEASEEDAKPFAVLFLS